MSHDQHIDQSATSIQSLLNTKHITSALWTLLSLFAYHSNIQKEIPDFDHSGLRAGESESEQKMRQCLCAAAAQWQAEKTQFIALLSIRT